MTYAALLARVLHSLPGHSCKRSACSAVQGMTVDLCKVHLGNMFAEGQAYVALSRARSIEGLQITGFAPGCVKVSQPSYARRSCCYMAST